MDREKVIKGLDICANGNGCKDGIANPLCPYSSEVGCDLNQILLDALDLLKKQEAVEPRKKDDGNPQPWTAWWYVCGDCGQEIEYHDSFCRWCGRAVKWK